YDAHLGGRQGLIECALDRLGDVGLGVVRGDDDTDHRSPPILSRSRSSFFFSELVRGCTFGRFAGAVIFSPWYRRNSTTSGRTSMATPFARSRISRSRSAA